MNPGKLEGYDLMIHGLRSSIGQANHLLQIFIRVKTTRKRRQAYRESKKKLLEIRNAVDAMIEDVEREFNRPKGKYIP